MTLLNPITTLYLIFSIILATTIASFFNVLIYRIPRGIQFVRGNSFCPGCGKRIKARHLIPILSYIALRGKCRDCGQHISLRYPIVEALGGVLAAVAILRFGFTAAASIAFLYWMILLAIAFIDAEHMVIPDGLTICLALLGLAWALVFWVGWGWNGMLGRAAGFFILSLPMLALTFFIPNAFGGGDIKLIAVAGFLLEPRLTLLAGFIAVLLGGIYASYIKYIKMDKSVVHISFGQYLAIGIFAAMLYGEEIITAYLSLFSF